MWVLDTDHLTILKRGGSTALSLQMRVRLVPVSEVATAIVNYEEQMRGWLAPAAQANTPKKRISAYARLGRHIEIFRDIPIFPFERSESEQFESLRKAHLSIGAQDLKIAASCLARDATLLTRNLRDFNKVPGLRAEDWSV